jgi:hypothetical protein
VVCIGIFTHAMLTILVIHTGVVYVTRILNLRFFDCVSIKLFERGLSSERIFAKTHVQPVVGPACTRSPSLV